MSAHLRTPIALPFRNLLPPARQLLSDTARLGEASP